MQQLRHQRRAEHGTLIGADACDGHRRRLLRRYGLSTWGHLFTPRQPLALTTFSDLVGEAGSMFGATPKQKNRPDGVGPSLESGTAPHMQKPSAPTWRLAVKSLANGLASICVWNKIGDRSSTFRPSGNPDDLGLPRGQPFRMLRVAWARLRGVGPERARSDSPWRSRGSGQASDASEQSSARARSFRPTRPTTTTSAMRTSPTSSTSGSAATEADIP